MFKKSKKKLSVLLVLAMVMTMLAGLAAPAGATTPVVGVEIGGEPTIVIPSPGISLQNIRFAESGASIGNIQTNNTITVTLPSGVVFTSAVPAGIAPATIFAAAAGSVTATTTEIVAGVTTSITLTLTRVADSHTAAAFTLFLPVTVTTPLTAGPINVTVATNTDAISDGTFAVGTYGTGVVTVERTFATGTTPTTFSRFDTATQTSNVNIRLRENAAGAFAVADAVVLTLPVGATWTTVSPTVNVITPGAGVATASVDADARRLLITRAAGAATATTFTLSGIGIVVNRLAELGDLTVTVTGEGDNAGVTGSVVLARVADFGIDVRRPTTGATAIPSINAGLTNGATVLNNMIEVKEATVGSLIAGGTITLTLPAGVQFNTAAVPTEDTVTIVAATTLLSNGNRTATFNVQTHGSARTVLFDFPAESLLVSPAAAAGDVAVTVAGTAGASGTVNIATVRPTFTISAATTPAIGLGLAAQTAADLVITEAAFGRIRTGDLELVLPAGITFSGTPTVTRASGNITLDAASIGSDARGAFLRIPVTASTVASVVYVSGIRYNVSRIAMDGPVNVTVDGSSLGDMDVLEAFSAAVAGNRPRVANARVGVAVPVRPSSVFTIGALSFLLNGVSTAIDAAPVIVGGRTLLPLRFAALAVGVSADNILWDPVSRRVTLIGDRVVQLQIGSTNMLINGVAVPLEVAPTIINGRTMLPIRALAQALRADVVWDGTARTVTVTPR